MEIIAGPLDWTSVDEENLAKFLETETGKRFIPKLVESVPPLLEKGETNEIMIRSGMVRGFQEVARGILSLSHSAQPLPRPASAYPALEDDAAWADGNRLETPPQSPTAE